MARSAEGPGVAERALHLGCGLVEGERLAGLDAEPLHLRQDRMVVGMWRVVFGELAEQGEVARRTQPLDLLDRRCRHVPTGLTVAAAGAEALPHWLSGVAVMPAWKRCTAS